MNLTELCEMIELPTPVRAAVATCAFLPEVKRAERYAFALRRRDSWEYGVKAIGAELGDDPDGMKMLAFMLLRAVESHDRYAELLIDDAIFADTMKFCTRFVNEHHRAHGRYAFTWGWWMLRQLSLSEFRFGALEYEMVDTGPAPFISIHIPGDALLTPDRLRASYQLARASIRRIAPTYADAPMSCDSWMLSPVLDQLLPATSRILAFKANFEIVSVDPTNPHATRWIFGRTDLPVDQLPELTSLQRGTKALMLQGGSVGAAVGILRHANWAAD